jgi:uncharacterized membrane protein SirB2
MSPETALTLWPVINIVLTISLVVFIVRYVLKQRNKAKSLVPIKVLSTKPAHDLLATRRLPKDRK